VQQHDSTHILLIEWRWQSVRTSGCHRPCEQRPWRCCAFWWFSEGDANSAPGCEHAGWYERTKMGDAESWSTWWQDSWKGCVLFVD